MGLGAGQEVSVSLGWKLERPVVTDVTDVVILAQFGGRNNSKKRSSGQHVAPTALGLKSQTYVSDRGLGNLGRTVNRLTEKLYLGLKVIAEQINPLLPKKYTLPQFSFSWVHTHSKY